MSTLDLDEENFRAKMAKDLVIACLIIGIPSLIAYLYTKMLILAIPIILTLPMAPLGLVFYIIEKNEDC